MQTKVIEREGKRFVIDVDTGEILHTQEKKEVWVQDDEVPLAIKSKDKKGRQPQFHKLYRTNLMDIALKKKLSFSEAGVLLHLMAFIDWESNFLIHPKTNELLNESEIAKLLKCERKSLSKHIKELNRKGFISIVNNGNGNANKFIINSHLIFNGRKIKDKREHEVFKDGAYQPKTMIKYEQSPNKVKRL